MGIVHYWANDEQTVLKVDFMGMWTVLECLGEVAVIERMFYRQGKLAYVVADFAKSNGIPAQATLIVQRILKLRSDNCGVIAVINLSPKAEAFWEACTQLFPEFTEYFLKADNLDAAVQDIVLHRASIA